MFQHQPVLLQDVLTLLTGSWQNPPKDGFLIVDCTLGGAGHAAAIVTALHELYPTCQLSLIGLDQDAAARAAASERLCSLQTSMPNFQFKIFSENFRNLHDILRVNAHAKPVDIMLADIGVSSHQIDTPERGFSIASPCPLDMRMNPNFGSSAKDLLSTLDEHELARIFFEFAEEPRSRRLARAIVTDREAQRLNLSSASAFAQFCKQVLGYHHSRSDPAIRIFQALRIAVNDELGALRTLLEQAPLCMERHHGRIGLITFHSLEDRIVKKAFHGWEENCYTENGVREGSGAEFPRGGLTALGEEAKDNPRSRSARLRVFHFGCDRRSLRSRFGRAHPTEISTGEADEN